jgi:hypothetical protein
LNSVEERLNVRTTNGHSVNYIFTLK